MKKASKNVKRKPGRPATGTDPFVGIRLPAEMLTKIDKAAKAEGVSRSKKIRTLIEAALK